MKRLTKKILQKSLVLAAIASVIFLFAPQINISAQNNPYLETGKKLAREGLYKEAINKTGRNRTSPEGAPTEEEVKQAIDNFTREFYDAYNGSKAWVSSWDSPIQILSGRKDIVNTDPDGDQMMYPVKVDFTITIEGKRTIRYTGGAL